MDGAGRTVMILVALVFALPVIVIMAIGGGGESTLDPACGAPAAVGGALPSGTPFTQEMAENARTVVTVGQGLGADQRAHLIALAAALVESGLRNLDHGHADSVGLFQQRPSQGWGDLAQIMDPTYASRRFYEALLAIPNWQQLDPGDAAQRVQRSAHPDRYARRMTDALSILTGSGGIGATSTPPGSVPMSSSGGPTPSPSPGPPPGSSPLALCRTAEAGNGQPGQPGDMVDVAVPSGGTITVHPSISDALGRLLAAADADGIRLGGSGYRSHERQIELRRSHCGPTDYDIYERPSDQCSPPTARPGRSLHESGLAIDFTCGGGGTVSRGDRCDPWLRANAPSFGLYNLPSEAWHYSVDGS